MGGRSMLLWAQNHKCFYCYRPFTGYHEVTRDHVYPVSRGGAKKYENIVLSCGRCNQKKGHRLPTWEEKQRQLEIHKRLLYLKEQTKKLVFKRDRHKRLEELCGYRDPFLMDRFSN